MPTRCVKVVPEGTTYAVQLTDDILACGNAATLVLPGPVAGLIDSAGNGPSWVIKKADETSGVVTVRAATGDMIEFAAALQLQIVGDGMELFACPEIVQAGWRDGNAPAQWRTFVQERKNLPYSQRTPSYPAGGITGWECDWDLNNQELIVIDAQGSGAGLTVYLKPPSSVKGGTTRGTYDKSARAGFICLTADPRVYATQITPESGTINGSTAPIMFRERYEIVWIYNNNDQFLIDGYYSPGGYPGPYRGGWPIPWPPV